MRSDATWIDREQVQLLLSEEAQLVEVQPRAEYEDEHLSGAINIPLKELDRESVLVAPELRAP